MRWSRQLVLCAGALVLAFPAHSVRAQQFRAQAAAGETENLYLGESFPFTVQVRGTDKVEEPDLSGLRDFVVEAREGRANNSESVVIVNGRMNRTVRRGYVWSYRLHPNRAGTLTIPSLAVRAADRTLRTEPVQITVRTPAETEHFKFRIKFSKEFCYVGEPVVLTVTLYADKDASLSGMRLPVLADDAFIVADPEREMDPSRKYFRLSVNGAEAIGEQGRGTLDGRAYETVTFSKVVIPKRRGLFEFAPGTAVLGEVVGYQRSRDPFGNFFGFGVRGGRRPKYRKVVIPSNAARLRVAPLPAEGRPDNFAGHVGAYRILVSAKPLEVNVGDPITLTITLSGPPYLKHVRLPDLARQSGLARDFKIPKDMADGRVEGRNKIFTQTIRARHAEVTEIPPLELPYFDTAAGEYRVARSAPIPLTVRETKIVTARDAEGLESTPSGSALEAWSKGIAHNYEDPSALQDQRYGLEHWARAPGLLALAGLPPVAYLVLLVAVTLVRRRHADPLAFRARKAHAEFSANLLRLAAGGDSDVHAAVLRALTLYLAAKLRLPSGVIGFRDVEGLLRARGVPEEDLGALEELMQTCEAGRYAGGSSGADPAALPSRARAVVRVLEKRLR